MDESILTTIKELLGSNESYIQFDSEITRAINTVFSELTQMGVGPETGFFIIDKIAVWTDFIQDMSKFEMIKSYVHLKVKLLFDPPSSSILIDNINKQIARLEWRLYTESGGL